MLFDKHLITYKTLHILKLEFIDKALSFFLQIEKLKFGFPI